MRIRTKLAIAVVLAAVVLSGVVVAGLEVFKGRTASQVHEEVNQSAAQTAGQVDAVVQERVNTVNVYASRPRIARLDRPGPYLDQFVDTTRFYAAQVVAPNGTVIAYRGQIDREQRERIVGQDVSEQPYVSELGANASGFYVSDIQRAETIRGDVLVISALMFHPETGEPSGVFAGAIRIGDEGTAEGEQDVRSEAGSFFIAAKPLQTERQYVEVNGSAENGTVTLLERRRTFDSAIAATATVESTGWTVTVARDRGPLNDRLRDLALAQGFGILLIVGVVAGLGYWEYSMNLSQTERLLDGFSRLQDGDYDYSLSLSAAEEWRQISDGYNALSTGLGERERAIREREQRLGVLNRLLRHNLRNDMSVILSYAEMMPDFEDRERREEAADKIREMGQGLIDHGQKARDIETAMEDAESGTTDIEVASLVRDVVADYEAKFEGVTFTTDLPGEAAAEAIGSLTFAIENLVENAAEHNDADDPAVSVSVEERDGEVLIDVADNGPGIPEHEREVLSAGEETPLEHGSGVGLWLAQWVVEKSGGRLRFRENDPRGSVVTIELSAVGAAEPDNEDANGTADTTDTADRAETEEGDRTTDAGDAESPGEDREAGDIVDEILDG